MFEAFSTGDPEKAWQAVRSFVQEVRAFSDEAAQDRFAKNFGGPRCESCEGLKAGPNVTATCFQIRRCFFTNRKSIDVSKVLSSVVDKLESEPRGVGTDRKTRQ